MNSLRPNFFLQTQFITLLRLKKDVKNHETVNFRQMPSLRYLKQMFLLQRNQLIYLDMNIGLYWSQ